MDTDTLRKQLAGLPLGEVLYLERTGSTNAVALERLNQGAPDTALVAADEQTAGRGRFDRKWVTRPGAALAFSLVLRPAAEEVTRMGFYSPLAALGVAEALEGLYGLVPRIKWPNDVLLDGRKAAGILVESVWDGDQPQGAVLGIGLNVTRDAVPPAEELLFPATSVEDALGRRADRWALLRAVLAGVLAWRPRLGSPEFLSAWESRLAFRGEWVRITSGYRPGEEREGRLIGIATSGSLRLLDEQGREFRVEVGDLHLRPARPA